MESKWTKYFATAAIFYGSAILGVMNGFFGPSLIEFKDALNTDIATINVVSTTCQVFLLVSIFCFSIVCKYIRRETLSPIILALLGTATTLLPYSNNLLVFALLLTLIAISRGGFIAVQLVWIIDIWKESSGPFLQAQHFFQAVGIIFPPLIFAPYLSESIASIAILPLNMTSSNSSHLLSSTLVSSNEIINEDITTMSPYIVVPTPNLHIPSAICGGIAFLGALMYLVLYLVLRRYPENHILGDLIVCDLNSEGSLSSSSDTVVVSTEQIIPPSTMIPGKYRKNVLMLFSILIYGSFISVEYTNVDFITQFLHYSQLQISTAEGAKILIYSAVSYVIFTFVGILLNLKISSNFIIWGNVVLLIGGITVLWVATTTVKLELVRIAGTLIGIGLSTGEPSIYHYVNSHLSLTTVTGAILTVSSGILVLSYRYLLGALIDIFPLIYLYVNVVNIAGVILGMIGIHMYGFR